MDPRFVGVDQPESNPSSRERNNCFCSFQKLGAANRISRFRKLEGSSSRFGKRSLLPSTLIALISGTAAGGLRSKEGRMRLTFTPPSQTTPRLSNSAAPVLHSPSAIPS